MWKLWLLGLKKMSTFTGMAQIIFTPEIINYKSRKMTIQKQIRKKYLESISFR